MNLGRYRFQTSSLINTKTFSAIKIDATLEICSTSKLIYQFSEKLTIYSTHEEKHCNKIACSSHCWNRKSLAEHDENYSNWNLSVGKSEFQHVLTDLRAFVHEKFNSIEKKNTFTRDEFKLWDRLNFYSSEQGNKISRFVGGKLFPNPHSLTAFKLAPVSRSKSDHVHVTSNQH